MATDKLVDFDHVTDYISREAALSCFHDWIDRYGHEHSADEMTEYQRIEDLPVADVRPVVRGKWEVGGMFDDIGRCSCCHYMFPSDTAMTEFRFCPNCGADMEGNENG